MRTFQVLYPFEMYTHEGKVVKVKRNSTITIDESTCNITSEDVNKSVNCEVDLMDITDRLRESFH